MIKKIIILLFLLQTSYAESLIYNDKIHSNWTPVTYYLNSTFDVIQNPSWFNQKDIEKKHEIVWKRIRSPHSSIKNDGGYKKLIKNEFFTGRVLPNIALHTFGNSYDTRLIYEYFLTKEVSYAPLWTFLLTYAAHIGNEALETSQVEEIDSHDHIADLYFFDIIGFSLAFQDNYLNYMLNDLGMETWHFQPAWDIKNDNFFNAGLNYIYRPSYFSGTVQPIIYTGMQNMAGISIHNNASTYSTLAGLSLTDPLRQKGRFVVGLFYEKNKSLSSSLFINGSENFRWRLNLYPAAWKNLKNQGIDFAMVLGETSNDKYAMGLSVNMPFSLGLYSK